MHFTIKNRVPYNKLLTYLTCSSLTGDYWPSVVFVRTSLRSVRTATTSGQSSPARPSRSVSKRLLIVILRRQYHIILMASWRKTYSVLGGVAKRRSPIRNIFSPNAVNIMWYCPLKIAISFVSRSIIYRDK